MTVQLTHSPDPRAFQRTRRRTCATACVIGCITASASAQTQVRDSAGAEELYLAALKLLKAGNWPIACEKFQKSMDLEPAASTQVKIAKCREHEGVLAAAWYDYQRALKLNEELEQTEIRRRELDVFIRARIAELEPKVPKLRIVVQNPPPALEIQRDGASVSLAVLGEPLPVDPGEHKIVATAPGYEEKSVLVEVSEGKLVEAELVLVKKPERPPVVVSHIPAAGSKARAAPPIQPANSTEPKPSAPPTVATTPPTASTEKHYASTQRWLGIAFGGAGIAALGVAGYFGLHTRDLVNEMSTHCVDGCDDDGIDLHGRAVRSQNTGFVLVGIGTAVLTTGIVLYASAPTRSSIERPRHVAVTLSPVFIGVRGTL